MTTPSIHVKISSYIRNNQWLILFVLLYSLFHFQDFSQPLVFRDHSWRQSDVMSVARQYATTSLNFFLPRIDRLDQQQPPYTGITGMELPLYPYLVALIYKVNGHIWEGFGRILSYLCALLSLYVLYQGIIKSDRVLKRLKHTPLLFVLPAVVMPFFNKASTMFMPEMLALLLTLTGFSCVHQYNRTQQNSQLILACLTLSIGILVRPYYAFFGLPLLVGFFVHLRANQKEAIKLCIAGLLTLVPFAAWYFGWEPHLVKTYEQGNGYFYMGDPIAQTISNFIHSPLILLHSLGKVVLKQYFVIYYSVFIVIGMMHYIRISHYNWRIIWLQPVGQLLLIALCALVIIPILSWTHINPHWYFLGAIFPAVVVFTYLGLNWLYQYCHKAQRWPVLTLGLFFLLYIHLGMNYTPTPRNAELMLLKQQQDLMSQIPKGSLIVTHFDDNPFPLYVIAKRGFVALDDKTARLVGAKYLLQWQPEDSAQSDSSRSQGLWLVKQFTDS